CRLLRSPRQVPGPAVDNRSGWPWAGVCSPWTVQFCHCRRYVPAGPSHSNGVFNLSFPSAEDPGSARTFSILARWLPSGIPPIMRSAAKSALATALMLKWIIDGPDAPRRERHRSPLMYAFIQQLHQPPGLFDVFLIRRNVHGRALKMV